MPEQIIECVTRLYDNPDGLRFFTAFVFSEFGPEKANWFADFELTKNVDGEVFFNKASEIYNRFFTDFGDVRDKLPPKPRVGATDAMRRLVKFKKDFAIMASLDWFPRFLKSPFCQSLIERLDFVGDSGEESLQYQLAQCARFAPRDAGSWISVFEIMADQLDMCLTVSDMMQKQQPLIVVNQAFVDLTGYSREYCVGKNCRFLQGSETNKNAVKHIRASLADGKDCYIGLINYKNKTKEQFRNLLAVRPLIDRGGLYRYCLGVQFSMNSSPNVYHELYMLDCLMKMLPFQLEVMSHPDVLVGAEMKMFQEPVSCVKCHFSTIVTIIMRQYEDRCHNSMHSYVNIVSKSVFNCSNVLFLGKPCSNVVECFFQ